MRSSSSYEFDNSADSGGSPSFSSGLDSGRYIGSRHDQYWQIAYPKFLVAQHCIKKDLKIFFYSRKLLRFWVKFSSIALVIDTF